MQDNVKHLDQSLVLTKLDGTFLGAFRELTSGS